MTFQVSAAGAVLRVDKPVGPTSHDIVVRVRRTLGIKRIGHTGTLDPFASGLMVVCVGPATRLSQYLTGLSKSYQATMVLGVETSTLDPEGDVVCQDELWREVSSEKLVEVTRKFTGPLLQLPPIFSAKKVDGERAYRRARRGETPELTPVEVEIHSLEITSFELPEVGFACSCSSGTYVRALGRDLAKALGTVGHLSGLRRTAIAELSVEGAVHGDALSEAEGIPEEAWIDPLEALAGMQRIEVESAVAARMRMGQRIDVGDVEDVDPLLVTEAGQLVAVGRVMDGTLQPSKVFPA